MSMNYALSGGHKKTIEAAEIILKQGGNAVDAAIAAYLVSFVAEPCMASLGAGGFALINDKEQIKVVDFFCQTPIKKMRIPQQDFYPVTVDFGRTTEDFHVGKGSIAVPGALAGIYKMHELYGTTPLKQLIPISANSSENFSPNFNECCCPFPALFLYTKSYALIPL